MSKSQPGKGQGQERGPDTTERQQEGCEVSTPCTWRAHRQRGGGRTGPGIIKVSNRPLFSTKLNLQSTIQIVQPLQDLGYIQQQTTAETINKTYFGLNFPDLQTSNALYFNNVSMKTGFHKGHTTSNHKQISFR